MNLPQHVVDNLERRWAAKLEQDVETWKKRKPPRCRQQECRIDRPNATLQTERARLRSVEHRTGAGHRLAFQPMLRAARF